VFIHDFIVSPKLSKDKQEEAIKILFKNPNRTAYHHCSLHIVVGMLYDLNIEKNTEDGLENGLSRVVNFIGHKLKEKQRSSII
jgi:hypothetical protein